MKLVESLSSLSQNQVIEPNLREIDEEKRLVKTDIRKSCKECGKMKKLVNSMQVLYVEYISVNYSFAIIIAFKLVNVVWDK